MKLTIDQILNQAIAAHKGSKFEEAEQLYKNILKAQPQNPDANHNLGVLKVSFNKSAEALPFFKTAIAVNPNIEQFWASYIDALVKENQFEEAEVSCRKAIELEPDNPKFYYILGNTLNAMSRAAEAEASYRKALELKPDFFLVHNNLGITLKNLGRSAEAEASYRKALEFKQDYAEANFNLGKILYLSKKYQDATEYFRLSNFKKSKSYLLSCLYKLGNESIFLKELEDVIKKGETNALIGSLICCSKIKYGTNKPNPFCNDPLDHILHTNLTRSCDFKNVFINASRDILKSNILSIRSQTHLTNGLQTVGNMFSQKSLITDEIQKILRLEIEKYRTHFKDSEEGFLKNWPSNYDLNGWLINMKSGGSLSAHMHENGWVTGSVYINVPPKLKADSGNLVVCIDNENNREENKKSIDIVTGSLCLFPSSLHHYTIPFESNEERIVLAFDVIPK